MYHSQKSLLRRKLYVSWVNYLERRRIKNSWHWTANSCTVIYEWRSYAVCGITWIMRRHGGSLSAMPSLLIEQWRLARRICVLREMNAGNSRLYAASSIGAG